MEIESSILRLVNKLDVPKSKMANSHYAGQYLKMLVAGRKSSHKQSWHDEIAYDLNSHGYRGDEFSSSEGLKVVSIGCSNVFGVEIKYEHTFPFVLSEMLRSELDMPVVNWNLAYPGKSADYMARMLSSVTPLLAPDLVIMNFPKISRREIIAESLLEVNYMPALAKWRSRRNVAPEAYGLIKAQGRIVSWPNDMMNLTLNFRLCKEVLNRCQAVWCYSTDEMRASQELTSIEGSENHIGDYLVSDKLAADGRHPGPAANQRFASAIILHLRQTGGLERLKANQSLQEV